MSVNIDLNTTIRVPLEVVAAIKAASDGDVSSMAGMEHVTTALNAAVVDAVKALPYEIRASQRPTQVPGTVMAASANDGKATSESAASREIGKVSLQETQKPVNVHSSQPSAKDPNPSQHPAGTHRYPVALKKTPIIGFPGPANDQVVHLSYFDMLQHDLRYLRWSPSVSMGEIRRKLEEAGYKPRCTFRLHHERNKFYPYRPGYSLQDPDRLTLLDMGFKGGEYIQVVPLQ